MSQDGARGHMDDFHAYISENSSSFCARSAIWNRQLVKEMIIQLVKKEALVIEINQFKTFEPPAICPLVNIRPSTLFGCVTHRPAACMRAQ